MPEMFLPEISPELRLELKIKGDHFFIVTLRAGHRSVGRLSSPDSALHLMGTRCTMGGFRYLTPFLETARLVRGGAAERSSLIDFGRAERDNQEAKACTVTSCRPRHLDPAFSLNFSTNNSSRKLDRVLLHPERTRRRVMRKWRAMEAKKR